MEAHNPTGVAIGQEVPKPVSAVIFDMDGLLLDTEGAYTVAQQRILDRFCRTFTWELKALMMGRQPQEGARVLLEALQLTPEEITPEQFLAERDALLRDVFPDSPLMPGAERLVRHLAAHRVPIALATGSSQSQFALKTSKHGELFGLFNRVITGDMVHRAKPDPAIFLAAAEGFPLPQPTPGSVLVFEDAPNGVEAALAAGMRVVMVPYPGMPEEISRGCGATAVFASLEDFKPEQWGLPPYTDSST
ncbi:hypothetical protein VOLCADRAFT_109270 [Volvox carteri f. nagariensis]|uniref:glycerol-1-phosphatase n=1 Tax=Volvox carteri f. nagariensis TaxID=3068 RepID=D8U7R3_VOLCA|nr:uncharacterized protein VOLCADRAFT_109270 [Volvox carteri f. nagariensis]EFJ44347.1 hypothetical protein VOLCADRAFT_109270 [Volvox carteri f. nagariensis]|eukprot:XP_002954706.1 hypothetical protein VOLCADRAFT_109270 [Volvox carteri f. nagariensis]